MLELSKIRISPIVLANANKLSMTIPVQFSVKSQIVETQALIDSGAEGQFLDKEFVRSRNIPITPLPKPITALNVNGTTNTKGTITHYTWLELTTQGMTTPTRLLITGLGKESVILGIPWLKHTKLRIDWEKGTLEFLATPPL